MSLGSNWKKRLDERRAENEIQRAQFAELAAQRRAADIIKGIPGIVRTAVESGQGRAGVMQLPLEEYRVHKLDLPLDRNRFSGAALKVYDYCIEEDLAPMILGQGMNRELWVAPKQ